MNKRPAFALALATLVVLPGCSLHPLYAGGGAGPVATTLTRVEVAPIAGKSGWLVATALNDRLHTGQDAAAPAYRLDVKLDDRIAGLAVRRDDSVARERRTLRARYQLIDLSGGAILLDATAGSDSGIDVVRSEYATIAAENTSIEQLSQTVADQIVARIALYVRGRGPAVAPAPQPVVQ